MKTLCKDMVQRFKAKGWGDIRVIYLGHDPDDEYEDGYSGFYEAWGLPEHVTRQDVSDVMVNMAEEMKLPWVPSCLVSRIKTTE